MVLWVYMHRWYNYKASKEKNKTGVRVDVSSGGEQMI